MDHEECWSCGYVLAIHYLPLGWYDLDPNGGCPADEIEALRRWGLL